MPGLTNRKRSTAGFRGPARLFLISVLFGIASAPVTAIGVSRPQAEAGVIDLRGREFSHNQVFTLGGEWEFVFGSFVEPDVVPRNRPLPPAYHVALPSTWSGFSYNGEPLPGTGFATYRLRVLLDEDIPERLAVIFPALETAYVLYVNGDVVAGAGTIGTNRDATVPLWKPVTVDFTVSRGDSLELLIHIANFEHARGGVAMMPRIGSVEAIRVFRERRAGIKLLTFGSLLMIALYHGAVFLMRRTEKGALYFALFSLVMAARSLVIDEHVILLFLPVLPWHLHIRLTYLTISLLVPVFLYYIVSLYPRETYPLANRALLAISIAYALVIVFGPPMVFSALLLPFQVVVIVAAIYCVVTLVLAWYRNRTDAALFFGAFAVYLGFVVNDILYHRMIIDTAYLAPTGFLVFVFLQAVILARRYSLAYVRIEELFREKTKLEGTTITLKSLTRLDALTSIANRRRLDEYLQQEWKRACRDETSLACVMIDIDHFKRYNDSKGHLAGDEVLRLIADTLSRSVHRPADLPVRYGGEEFAVLLPETDRAGAFALAEIIRAAVRNLAIPGCGPEDGTGETRPVTVSLGCAAMVPTQDGEPLDLIRRADIALYLAKQNGRDRVELFADDTGSVTGSRRRTPSSIAD